MKLAVKSNISTVIRILAVVLIACFLIPSFTVSCGAQHFGVSGVRLLTGTKINSELIMRANFGVLVLLCIPIGMIATWCVYRGNDVKDAALITMILAAIGFIGWLAVLAGMIIFTEKYNGDFGVTPVFALTLLCYSVVFCLSVSQYLKKGKRKVIYLLERPVRTNQSRETKKVYDKNQILSVNMRVCPVCHQPVCIGFSFCSKCGSRV